MTESFYFALTPKFLKTQHSFAKNVKPNTKYRLIVFKGIQKCDQMEEGTKSKIVGGKIELQSKELLFNIPYFSPTKNIAFTIKLYEQKPNEEETEIASYTLGSSDYIKQYKADKLTSFQVNAELQPNLSLQFDLYVEKSKELLSQILKNAAPAGLKSPRQGQQDNLSQQSKQFVREGEGFISPKRKIERKRGNESRLRSRSRSSQKSDILVTSPKSNRMSKFSVKNSDKVADNKSPVAGQKSYQYQPSPRLKYTDTKDIFDIKIQRSNSPVRSPKNVQSVIKSPQSRASFTSQPQQQQKNLQSGTQSTSNGFSRTNVSSPLQPKTNALTSPRSQSGNMGALEIKNTSKVFDIVPRQRVVSPKSQSSQSPGKYEPKRQPKVVELQQKNVAQSGKGSSSLLGSNLQSSNFDSMKESKIVITVEGQVSEPQAVIIGSESEQKDEIQVKTKQVKNSVRQIENINQKLQETESKKSEKSAEERKNDILYAIFLIVSVFLIYNAMCPTRRV